MKIYDIAKIKNNDFIVLLPDVDYMIRESVEYSFKNVFYLDYEPTESEVTEFIKFINNGNNELIIFDYSDFYRRVLPHINKKIKIHWVYKNNISTLTDFWSRDQFNKMLEYYDRNIVNDLVFLDYAAYRVLKNSGYKTKYIKLDINPNRKKAKKSKSIGLLGNDYNPNHNIYNQLSSIKMIDYSYIKLLKSMPATKHFISFFNIKEKEVNTIDEVIENNNINLYCNFTFNCYELILKSMDMGIPCLLGNTDFFDSNKKLKKYLVLDSDDDIGEIADKISIINNNKEEIFKEYKNFRIKYSKDSVNSIKQI